MQIEEGAAYVIRQLNKAGYEAYAVGGCVRDALRLEEPSDWDITTSALPEEVKALFPKTFDTGIAHGTVSVLHGGKTYEVTTFRQDGGYQDHRHPETVTFTVSLYEDVARRDFTINAMAYHPEKGLMDFFCGQEDLQRGIIRCVGDPMRRFQEDALRMLRAIRFAAKLDFRIEESTWQAICQLAPTLSFVSKERIMDETVKTLLSAHPEGLQRAKDAGLLPYMAPELGQGKRLNFTAPAVLPPDRILRFAALLSPMTPEEAGRVLTTLKSDNHTRHAVVHLLRHLHDPLPLCGDPQGGKRMRLLLHEVGVAKTQDLIALKEVCLGEDVAAAKALYREQKEAPVTLKDLKVTGKDLLEDGAVQGKQLGETLNRLMMAVLENPALNDKKTLLGMALSDQSAGSIE